MGPPAVLAAGCPTGPCCTSGVAVDTVTTPFACVLEDTTAGPVRVARISVEGNPSCGSIVTTSTIVCPRLQKLFNSRLRCAVSGRNSRIGGGDGLRKDGCREREEENEVRECVEHGAGRALWVVAVVVGVSGEVLHAAPPMRQVASTSK